MQQIWTKTSLSELMKQNINFLQLLSGKTIVRDRASLWTYTKKVGHESSSSWTQLNKVDSTWSSHLLPHAHGPNANHLKLHDIY